MSFDERQLTAQEITGILHVLGANRPGRTEPDETDRKKEIMVQVTVNEGDDLERVLRRFKRQVQKAGIFTDLKRKKHYEKPSETRKRKRNAARRRSRRTRRVPRS